MRQNDPMEARCRELALAAGIDPDSRIAKAGSPRGQPAWCGFRDTVNAERQARDTAAVAATLGHSNAPLAVFGEHDPATIEQMRNCMATGRAVAGVVCADGHIGYAQPVGGVIAYEGQISVSGVGFDIGCGNMAVRLDTPMAEIRPRLPLILADIAKNISFGMGRANAERVEHALFDDEPAWVASGMMHYKQKAHAQLGTVGSGNHYVDLMEDEAGMAWIGVHFGSRGLGHTAATQYLKLGGGRDGMHVAPTVLEEASDLGQAYLAAMELAGRYAYAGREWVVERVRRIIGGAVTDSIHNHHNYAWRENHGGRDLWVVRKGATPAFPGQRGFVGGSMGDDAVIVEGIGGARAEAALHSTIHGAGRRFGRREAMRRFTRVEMEEWLRRRGVLLHGAGLDESPMAYRRLDEVVAAQGETIRVLYRLRPVAVAMAGEGEFDPFKD